MSGAESFDAFYARTVASVTAAMHDLAGGDPQADHAIREAYALVYQQWYEVSGYRDPDAWVMDAAKQAYERRRDLPSAPDTDSSTWPNMYRQPTPAGTAGDVQPPVGQPTAAMAGVGAHGPAPPAPPTDAMPGGPQWPGYPGSVTGAAPGRAGQDPAVRPGAGPRRAGRTGAQRQLIAIVAVVAVLAAGVVAYFAFGRGPAQTGSGGTPTSAPAAGHSTPTMLRAGQQGTRQDVPWSLVGRGWTLAEVSAGAASANGPQDGASSTFLVDPLGGRYLMHTWQAGSNPQPLAWSGDKKNALFELPSNGYQLLTLRTGQAAPLTLPANVLPAGFTQPDGLNILAVRITGDGYRLQRYDLTGQFQATLGHMPRRPDGPLPQGSCMSGDCAALSSAQGDMAVWGTSAAHPMQLVSNVGDHLIRKLHVPGSDSCTPISWWDPGTVLAVCDVRGALSMQSQLWLVPLDGSSPAALTTPAGSPVGSGFYTGAWRAGGHVFATVTANDLCPGVMNPERDGSGILNITNSTTPIPVSVAGNTHDYAAVVGRAGSQLLILAQTGCGTSSLVRLSPSSGATQAVLAGQSGQAGVVGAVPYGGGPAASAP